MLLKLQHLYKPDLLLLEAVSSEECKNTKCHIWLCQNIIATVTKFEDFISFHSHYKVSIYIQVLYYIVSSFLSTVIFAYEDIWLANIIIHAINDNKYIIIDIVD